MAEDRKSRKGENKSVRFDEKKYEFICVEEKLETPQEVVDFLVDKYWWEKKIGFKTEELPTNGRQEKPTEEKQSEAPKEEVKKPNNVYFKLLNEARMGTMDEAEMRTADLSPNQIDLLIRKNNENKQP